MKADSMPKIKKFPATKQRRMDSGIIVPRTPVGIATVRVLNMNAEQRSFARKLQIEAGLIA